MDEAAAAAARLADARHARRRAREVRADRGAVDARGRGRVERRAAQRVQRRERAVDVDRRRAVEREVDLFFVFVLPEDAVAPPHAALTHERRRRARRARRADSRCDPRSCVNRTTARESAFTANDIVKICALSDRRQLADVPRVSRAGPHRGRRAPAQRAGDADQRGLHLRHDAAQAAQRAQAGVHRRVVRSARPHLPRRSRRRLQGQPRADAGRARGADPDGARRLRGARRADPHLRALRGRRCDRDAGGEGGGGRLRRRDRHRRQGLLSAGRATASASSTRATKAPGTTPRA